MSNDQSSPYLELSTQELEKKLRGGKLSSEDRALLKDELLARYAKEFMGAQDKQTPNKTPVVSEDLSIPSAQKSKGNNTQAQNIATSKRKSTVMLSQSQGIQKRKSGGVWGVIVILIVAGVIAAIGISEWSVGTYCQINDGRGTCWLRYESYVGSPCTCTDGLFNYAGTVY